VDDLIDVIEGNRRYVRCLYVYNKVDMCRWEFARGVGGGARWRVIRRRAFGGGGAPEGAGSFGARFWPTPSAPGPAPPPPPNKQPPLQPGGGGRDRAAAKLHPGVVPHEAQHGRPAGAHLGHDGAGGPRGRAALDRARRPPPAANAHATRSRPRLSTRWPARRRLPAPFAPPSFAPSLPPSAACTPRRPATSPTSQSPSCSPRTAAARPSRRCANRSARERGRGAGGRGVRARGGRGEARRLQAACAGLQAGGSICAPPADPVSPPPPPPPPPQDPQHHAARVQVRPRVGRQREALPAGVGASRGRGGGGAPGPQGAWSEGGGADGAPDLPGPPSSKPPDSSHPTRPLRPQRVGLSHQLSDEDVIQVGARGEGLTGLRSAAD
jgi:hypothetical protein